MSPLSYDKELASRLSSGMKGNDVTLPFTAPMFWWNRGDPVASSDGSGVRKFGGWASSTDQIDGQIDKPIPSNLKRETFANRMGESYEVYASRKMHITPICQRYRWLITDEDRATGKKGRGHLQILAMCASFTPPNKEQKTPGFFEYWAPVVLTAKGLTSRELQNVFKAFQKETVEARIELGSHDDPIPYFLFWETVGTFEKTVVQMKVGRGNSQNYITPPQLYIPEGGFSSDLLMNRFIGEDLAKIMGDLFDLAKDWVKEWVYKKPDETVDDGFIPNEPAESDFAYDPAY